MIKIGRYELDEQMARKYAQMLDENCARVNAHGFHRFIDQKTDDYSIVDYIENIRASLDFEPSEPLRVKASYEEQIRIVKDFYKKYFPTYSDKVDSILDGKHPDYRVSIEYGVRNKSYVGHKDLDTELQFMVGLDGPLDGTITLAHELSHAVSAHHTSTIAHTQAIRDASLPEERDRLKGDFHAYIGHIKSFDVDCLGEIESYVVEKLFVKYLLDKGIISASDYENYFSNENNSLIHDIDRVLGEHELISNLPCPITYDSLLKLVQSKASDPRFEAGVNLMRVLAEAKDEGESGKYRFRYVVGRIVSSLWYENYLSTDDRRAMLDSFAKYLAKTDQINVDDACEMLLGRDLVNSLADYVQVVEEKKATTV